MRGIYGPISHSPLQWRLQERADGNMELAIVKFELVRGPTSQARYTIQLSDVDSSPACFTMSSPGWGLDDGE